MYIFIGFPPAPSGLGFLALSILYKRSSRVIPGLQSIRLLIYGLVTPRAPGVLPWPNCWFQDLFIGLLPEVCVNTGGKTRVAWGGEK